MHDDDEPRRPYQHPYQNPDETPTDDMPALSAATARTVHRLRHIRQVSDLAINVIDQALERAS
ncbi:hypothetical protein ACFWYW_04320 [Nonomuraea sp. NPDC059023]|uniref:hypothetical protein n=1 Tax=unclassified Nonomuraea TaxID=2593643 RepID=UPI003689A482